jgi:Flp pilus assembly protein CpaB
MKTKWSIIVLVVLGLTAALCTALLTASIRAQQFREVVHLPSPEVKMLVAAKAVPAMTTIDAAAIAEKTVPSNHAPESYFSEPAQIIGKVLTVPVVEGQAFTKASFPIEGTGSHLAALLPEGKRAVCVSLSDYSGLEGLLYPGCVVDVLASFKVGTSNRLGNAVSTTLLENIEILAVENLTVGSPSEEREDSSRPSHQVNRGLLVALMVDSEQAEALQLAMEHGTISLAMRNPKDAHLVDRDPTLLSELRLAEVSELLAPTVASKEVQSSPEPETDHEDQSPSEETVARVSRDEPHEPVPVAVALLRVEIIRGLSSETRSFPPLTTH